MSKRNPNKIKEGKTIYTVLVYVAVAFLCFLAVYPMYYVLIMSLSSPENAAQMNVYVIPKGFCVDAYKVLVQDPEMWRAYLNTIIYVIPTTILMLATCVLVAYPLTYKRLMGRKFVNMFLLIPMYFGGGMIPWYLLYANVLNLKGTAFVIWFPGITSSFLVILMRTFIQSSVPDAIAESAKIDGAGPFTIFIKIVLPVLKPGLATVGLFLALGYWNDWYRSSLFSTNANTYELQFYLYNMLSSTTALKDLAAGATAQIESMPGQSMKMAMAVIVTGPVLLFYPFVQRYFVSGITVGAVKG